MCFEAHSLGNRCLREKKHAQDTDEEIRRENGEMLIVGTLYCLIFCDSFRQFRRIYILVLMHNARDSDATRYKYVVCAPVQALVPRTNGKRA